MNCSRFKVLTPFFQKCSSIHDCAFFLCYNFDFTLLHLHRPSLCFYHCLHLRGLLYYHLHLYGWLYFHLYNVLLPYVSLCCMCFHKVLLHSFIFLWFFNEHYIYRCSSWSYLFFYTPTSFTSAQKFNYICSNYIYVLNYHFRKLYLLIIWFPFCTFWRWCEP
jgi:hypothetical protein